MSTSSDSTNAADPTGTADAAKDAVQHEGTRAPAGNPELAQKQQMVEKLFQHTNQFLRENAHDPLLVVEALAAILVRYAALLGPVAQMDARLNVLERLIGQECGQIKEIARAAASAEKGKPA